MPSSYEHCIDRGNVLFSLGEFSAALREYDVALLDAPDLATVHYCRANALARIGAFREAFDVYDAAIALDAGDADAISNRALARLRLGQSSDAARTSDGTAVVSNSAAPVESLRSTIEAGSALRLMLMGESSGSFSEQKRIPTVAALVPAHNEEAIIGAAIESLLAQSRPTRPHMHHFG